MEDTPNEDDLKEINRLVANLINDHFEFKLYCTFNGLNENEPGLKERWRREQKINDLLKNGDNN